MLLGCDTSHFQTTPDYAAMRAGGLGFVIQKATQGIGYTDPTFAPRRAAARAAGLLDGAYHFANGGDVAAEADHFCDVVGPLTRGELVALDYEIHLADPVTWCLAWLRATRDRLGVKPGLYLNQSTMNGFDWTPVVREDFWLWLAKYDATTTAPAVSRWPFAAIKQYTDRGTASGIPGTVDCDVFYGDLAALQRYGFAGNVVAPTPRPTPRPAPHPAPPAFDVRNWRAHAGATGAVFIHLQAWANKFYPAYCHIAPTAPAYGPQTVAFLAEFSHRSGFASDGRDIGPKTAAALYAAGFRG